MMLDLLDEDALEYMEAHAHEVTGFEVRGEVISGPADMWAHFDGTWWAVYATLEDGTAVCLSDWRYKKTADRAVKQAEQVRCIITGVLHNSEPMQEATR